MDFRIDTSRKNGRKVGVVILPERLDAHNCSTLRNNFHVWGKETADMVFDCCRLDFLDSSGLGTIVFCLRQVVERQGDLKLAGIGSKVIMLLELTRAERLFSIHPDVDSAVASFGFVSVD